MPSARGFFSVMILSLVLLVSGGCANFQAGLEKPTVKVTGLRLLPSQGGLNQRIGVDLAILNPNDRDLSLRGISYTIGIENFSVLSGVTDNVPVLKGYQETPVSLEVSANMLQVVRLIEYFSRAGVKTASVTTLMQNSTSVRSCHPCASKKAAVFLWCKVRSPDPCRLRDRLDDRSQQRHRDQRIKMCTF